MKLFTIGFTKSSAQHFFCCLKKSGATKIIDVRLDNISQLAGFAKRDDLRYFAKEICGMEYEHAEALAPTQDILDEYKKHHGDWDVYAKQFNELMALRHIELLDRDALAGGCLLCSEDKPHHCHRRLVAEYLKGKWLDVEAEIIHL